MLLVSLGGGPTGGSCGPFREPRAHAPLEGGPAPLPDPWSRADQIPSRRAPGLPGAAGSLGTEPPYTWQSRSGAGAAMVRAGCRGSGPRPSGWGRGGACGGAGRGGHVLPFAHWSASDPPTAAKPPGWPRRPPGPQTTPRCGQSPRGVRLRGSGTPTCWSGARFDVRLGIRAWYSVAWGGRAGHPAKWCAHRPPGGGCSPNPSAPHIHQRTAPYWERFWGGDCGAPWKAGES